MENRKEKNFTLGDVCSITKLAGFEFTQYFKYENDGEIIAIRALNVKDGVLDLSDIKRVSKTTSDQLQRSKLFIGDIVLTYTGALLGQVAFISENNKYHLAPNVCLLRPEKIDPYFLYSFMRTKLFKREIEKYKVGSTQPTVPMKNIRLIECKNLDKKDQKNIGIIASCFDRKIAINKETNEALESISKALFKSWFIDFEPVKAKAEGRSTGLPEDVSSLFPDSFEDSESGKIPSGWSISSLGECSLHIESGKRPKGGIQKDLSNGIPSLGAESIDSAGLFDFNKTKYVTEEFANISKKGWVSNFDVALYKDGCGKGGEPGQFNPRVAIYGDDFPFKNFMINEHVFLLRSMELGQPFLYKLFDSHFVREQIIYMGSSKGAQPGLNQQEVASCIFIKPKQEIIILFNQISTSLLKKQFSLGKQNISLTKLRDTLLPKLISGEIRIPDAEKIIEEVGI